MKLLEYNFFDEVENLPIENYIESHSKKQNSWWKNLKGTSGLYKTHKEVFINHAKRFFNEKLKSSSIKYEIPRTAKTCPAIGDGVLDKIHLLKAPCDIFLSVKEDGCFYYELPDMKWLSIESHHNEQFHTEQNNIFKGFINIKFEMPIVINTNGCPYLFLEPQYHNPRSKCKVLNGLIDGIHTQSQCLNINTIVDIKTLQDPMIFKKGDVIAYLWTPEKTKLTYNKNLKFYTKSVFGLGR